MTKQQQTRACNFSPLPLFLRFSFCPSLFAPNFWEDDCSTWRCNCDTNHKPYRYRNVPSISFYDSSTPIFRSLSVSSDQTTTRFLTNVLTLTFHVLLFLYLSACAPHTTFLARSSLCPCLFAHFQTSILSHAQTHIHTHIHSHSFWFPFTPFLCIPLPLVLILTLPWFKVRASSIPPFPSAFARNILSSTIVPFLLLSPVEMILINWILFTSRFHTLSLIFVNFYLLEREGYLRHVDWPVAFAVFLGWWPSSSLIPNPLVLFSLT